jgi:hypothetical protein
VHNHGCEARHAGAEPAPSVRAPLNDCLIEDDASPMPCEACQKSEDSIRSPTMNCDEQPVRHSKHGDRASAARNAHITTSHGGVPAVGEITSGEERCGVSGHSGVWGMPYAWVQS